MRDFKGMKRQRGRNRTGGGAPSGGGGKPQQNVNRAFDSNGPDNVKIRGHAQHVFEKYQQLARDAFSSGDRVLAENYLQHADHYFRVLRTIQPNRAPAEILGRDVFASGLDIDFEDENEGFEDNGGADANAGETTDNGGEPQRFDNGRSEQRYDNNRYEGRSDNNRQDSRQDGGRQDGGRQDGGRQDGGRSDNRQDRQDGSRQDNGRRDERTDRYEGRQGQEPRRDFQENGRYDGRREGQDNREGRSNGRYADSRDNRDRENRDNRSDAPRSDRDDQPRETREFRTDNRRDYQENRAQEPRNEVRRDYQETRETSGEGQREPKDSRDATPDGRSRRQRAPREGRYGARIDADAQTSESQPRDPLAVIEPEAAPLPFAPAAKAEPEPSPVLRSQDGGVSQAPAFLQAPSLSAAEAGEDGEVRKPRVRRRRPKALEGADDSGDSPLSVAEDA
jgi:hypothetical protein